MLVCLLGKVNERRNYSVAQVDVLVDIFWFRRLRSSKPSEIAASASASKSTLKIIKILMCQEIFL